MVEKAKVGFIRERERKKRAQTLEEAMNSSVIWFFQVEISLQQLVYVAKDTWLFEQDDVKNRRHIEEMQQWRFYSWSGVKISKNNAWKVILFSGEPKFEVLVFKTTKFETKSW
jgi:hypothetical protein